ncbi:DUF819 domain-containing protein [hydrothermal vent metagenome]|uniref:DUF819 domain-containing protein n=1 Tax=hydrothermal vent metagenome TaxID=652676 RepID=A0A1W1D2D3_9ZZZZ
MITSPFLYLFTLAFIATLLTLSSNKIPKFIPPVLIIFITSLLVSFLGLFQPNEKIQTISLLTTTNLLPAMLFLMLLQLDYYSLFYHRSIGCACTIGTKKYWFLILLALVVSFFSQIIAIHFTPSHQILTSSIIALIFGFFASLTNLKYINGTREVANSMLYMVVALLGSKIGFSFLS